MPLLSWIMTCPVKNVCSEVVQCLYFCSWVFMAHQSRCMNNNNNNNNNKTDNFCHANAKPLQSVSVPLNAVINLRCFCCTVLMHRHHVMQILFGENLRQWLTGTDSLLLFAARHWSAGSMQGRVSSSSQSLSWLEAEEHEAGTGCRLSCSSDCSRYRFVLLVSFYG